MDRRLVRFSIDLVPEEYALLCDVQCQRSARGEHVALAGLLREAMRERYGPAAPVNGALRPRLARLPATPATEKEDAIRYTLDLPPATYALLARTKHKRSRGCAGRRVSLRTLILEAIHAAYGES